MMSIQILIVPLFSLKPDGFREKRGWGGALCNPRRCRWARLCCPFRKASAFIIVQILNMMQYSEILQYEAGASYFLGEHAQQNICTMDTATPQRF